MTTTERLQKHVDELEERKVSLFFDMQHTASALTSRMYTYYIVVIFASLIMIVVTFFVTDKNTFLVKWSAIFAFFAIAFSLMQYLFIFEKISSKLYSNVCDIYKKYDNEYYVLKKFNAGEIQENLIRQFYTNKTNDLKQYKCHIAQSNWISWTTASLLIGSIILLLLA